LTWSLKYRYIPDKGRDGTSTDVGTFRSFGREHLIQGTLRSHVLVAAIAMLLALAAGLSVANEASAASTVVCTVGTEAGNCDGPGGLAVDSVDERLFVADGHNNRIDAFGSPSSFAFAFGWGVADGSSAEAQKCTTTCFKGLAGSGAGQMAQPRWVAVDRDPVSPSFRDVYEGTDNFRVQKFDREGTFLGEFGSEGTGLCEFSSEEDPVAVGPGGTVYVLDGRVVGEAGGQQIFETRVEKFTAAGACAGQVSLGTKFAGGLGVDSSGNIYTQGQQGVARKFDGTGTLLCSTPAEGEANAVGVDGSGTLFVAGRQAPGFGGVGDRHVVTEYDASCNLKRRFGYADLHFNATGLAVQNAAAGGVDVSEEDVNSQTEGNRVVNVAAPPPGPIAVPQSLQAPAASVGSARATLKAELNPEGKETSYHFEYVTQKGFEEQGNSFTGPQTKSTPTQTLSGDFALHGVSVVIGCTDPVVELPEGKCLEPETTYRFRVVATNADGAGEGTATGPNFTTREPFEVLAFWAAEVGTDAATLRAEVNPLGVAATGFFEYVSDAKFNETGFTGATKAPAGEELSFGAGEVAAIRGTPLGGLSLGTTYHYRLVVKNGLGGGTTFTSQPHTFTTFALPTGESCPQNQIFRTGPSAALPDCRAYEMVSPLDKENGDIIPLGEGTTALPAALQESSTSGEKLVYGSYRSFGDAESAPFTTQYLAQREAGIGWSSHAIVSPRGKVNPNPLTTLDTELKALSPDLCDAWFRAVAEPPLTGDAVHGFNNIYRRHDESCGEKSYEAITTLIPPHRTAEEYNPLELQGLSENGTVALYVAPDNLPGTGAPELSTLGNEQRLQVYVHTPGKTTFVCVLPSGAVSTTPCQAGGPGTGVSRTATENNAISDDGSRVFWTSYPSFPEPGQIFLRRNPAQTQSPVSGGKCTQPAKACTIAVSEKAQELSGTTSSQFWAAAADGSKAIFTTANTGAGVSDLYEAKIEDDGSGHLIANTVLIAHKSPGILGASDDAKWIYFASEEALTGANGEGRSPSPGKPNLYLDHEGTLRFVMGLTPSDVANSAVTSAVNREPRFRVTRISPDGHFAAFLSQVSPSPQGYDNHDAVSGKADAEAYLYEAEASGGQGRLLCASCNPTGARPVGADIVKGPAEYWAASQIPVWENTLYASRVLADDGSRLYFNSTDALVPGDKNGVSDVYQWELPGTGGCEEADSTFSAAAAGCVELISSGQSAKASEFIDASPDGRDVFFTTLAGLVPQDFGLVDVYDARVDGGLPSPPPPAPECEGEACQHPAPAPELPSTSSEGFHGAGNYREEKPPPCPKGKVRKGSRCVPKHKKKHQSKKKHKSKNGRAGR
jgi:hypothetical protein